MQVEGKESIEQPKLFITLYSCDSGKCNISCIDGGEIHCLTCSGPIS